MLDLGNWTICKDNCAPMSPYVFVGELQKDELKDIEEILSTIKLTTVENTQIKTAWVEPSKKTEWLYKRIHERLTAVNAAYQFDELLMVEKIAYMEFGEGCELPFHADVSDGVPFNARRISAHIILNKSEDYRGGELMYMPEEPPYPVSRVEGTMIISPAYVLKKVEKITEGKKKMLVAWISSPSFKKK